VPDPSLQGKSLLLEPARHNGTLVLYVWPCIPYTCTPLVKILQRAPLSLATVVSSGPVEYAETFDRYREMKGERPKLPRKRRGRPREWPEETGAQEATLPAGATDGVSPQENGASTPAADAGLKALIPRSRGCGTVW
jgi:hypothetical protein